jgi:hypothetical protein
MISLISSMVSGSGCDVSISKILQYPFGAILRHVGGEIHIFICLTRPAYSASDYVLASSPELVIGRRDPVAESGCKMFSTGSPVVYG